MTREITPEIVILKSGKCATPLPCQFPMISDFGGRARARARSRASAECQKMNSSSA